MYHIYIYDTNYIWANIETLNCFFISQLYPSNTFKYTYICPAVYKVDNLDIFIMAYDITHRYHNYANTFSKNSINYIYNVKVQYNFNNINILTQHPWTMNCGNCYYSGVKSSRLVIFNYLFIMLPNNVEKNNQFMLPESFPKFILWFVQYIFNSIF
jgi:hypothetical protein